MSGSWKIATVMGIDIYLHATFLLLLGWLALVSFMSGEGLLPAISGMFFVGLVFAIIVMHEMGHALVARRFGVRTRDIVLLPIGGVARLEKFPEKPTQEMWIALAGPAVNLGLAGLLFVLLIGLGAGLPTAPLAAVGGGLGGLLTRLFWVNVVLAGFNLLPAFPMDGGRVVRALLAMRLERVSATRIAAALGRGMAMIFGLVGLLFNPFLIFIAFFVWIGATQEEAMVEEKSMLGGVPVKSAMITLFQTLAPADPLRRGVEYILAGFQHDFPVVEGGQVVGVLTRADLVAGLTRGGGEATVGDAMRKGFAVGSPEEMLEGALSRLRDNESRTLCVLSDGQLVGMVTLENVGEFVMVKGALDRRKAS